MSLPPYAELHCLSNFTFLRGASHPQELVRQAHVLGYSALALTDECTFAGAVRAHVAARELGFKLIVGTELKLADGLSLLLLADDIKAYRQISALTPELDRADHDNKLFSRMPLARLDAEAVRDSILKVAGRLDPERFGEPSPIEVQPDGNVVTKQSPRGSRRSIYMLHRRTTILSARVMASTWSWVT